MERVNKIKKNKYSISVKGIALLYSVVISSIILSITIGVSNIAFREINFSTSMKEGNDAFYAADAAVECVLQLDSSDPAKNPFTGSCSDPLVCPTRCNNTFFSIPSPVYDGDYVIYNNMILGGLGISGKSCVHLDLIKPTVQTTPPDPPNVSTIRALGYNIHASTDGFNQCTPLSTSAQRVLEVTY